MREDPETEAEAAFTVHISCHDCRKREDARDEAEAVSWRGEGGRRYIGLLTIMWIRKGFSVCAYASCSLSRLRVRGSRR